MFRKNFIGKQLKGVSKQIRKKFGQILDSLELELRLQNINKQQNLQKMQIEVKKLSRKINQFSNILLEDNFEFSSLQQHPLVMVKYCQIMMNVLIENFKSENQIKNLPQTQKSYNQNNVYEVVAAVRLQNFDLKQKMKILEKQLDLSKERAQCAETITQTIRVNSQNFLKNYQSNFAQICQLLKKAEATQIQLLQNNRFLKQQLQSLSIQFQRYKEYFKQGPSLKEKQFKMKNQLERQYEMKLKNLTKQVETSIRSQLERSIVEKFQLKDIKNLNF